MFIDFLFVFISSFFVVHFYFFFFFFFQAEDGIRDFHVTGVQTCALPIYHPEHLRRSRRGRAPRRDEQGPVHPPRAAGRSDAARRSEVRGPRVRVRDARSAHRYVLRLGDPRAVRPAPLLLRRSARGVGGGP